MLAVLTAMPREASSFAKTIHASPVRDRGQLSKGVIGGTGVLISTVGIGARETERVVSELTREHGVTEILALGYAGAASPDLRAGDLVLGTDTCLVEDSSLGEPRSTAVLDAALIAKAESALSRSGIRYHVGKIGTVSRVATEPEVKEGLGKRLGVKALDMETHHMAETVSRYGLPFLAVRAILDPVEMRLPEGLDTLYEDGRFSLKRVLTFAGRHPGELWRLPGIGLKARAADRALNGFIRSFLFVN